MHVSLKNRRIATQTLPNSTQAKPVTILPVFGTGRIVTRLNI